MENNITLREIAELIKTKNNILVAVHERPDGDCIGSAFALKYAFADKNIKVVCSDAIPERLAFLCDTKDVSLPDDVSDYFIIAVDCASAQLMGKGLCSLADKVDLKIDHHATGKEYATLEYTDSTAGAAGEIVFEIIKLAGAMNKRCADALYAAVSSDTGGFRYANTSATTLRRAAEIVEAGADSVYINSMLYENKGRGEIRATLEALRNLKYYFEGRVAITGFSNEAKKRENITDDDLGCVSSLPREIEGVDLGVVIKEREDAPGVYKISTRSNDRVDCTKICSAFGGGGHLRAAGASLEADNFEDAVEKIVSVIGEVINE